MPENTTKSPMSRDRKLILLSAALLLIAGSIFGGIFLLQWQGARAQPARFFIPKLTDAEEDSIIARTRWLRDRWQPWASAHKDSLEQMLHANTTDQTALMQIYDQIPDCFQFPQQLGFQSTELIQPNVSLCWLPNGARGESKIIWKDPRIPNDPAYKENSRKADAYEARMRQEAFTRFHNIAIARSMNKGVVNIILWADGRITRVTIRFNSESVYPEQESSIQELAPRYDFLR